LTFIHLEDRLLKLTYKWLTNIFFVVKLQKLETFSNKLEFVNISLWIRHQTYKLQHSVKQC